METIKVHSLYFRKSYTRLDYFLEKDCLFNKICNHGIAYITTPYKIKKMKYFLCGIFSCIFLQSFSQNYFDILNLTYTNTTPNDFEVSDKRSTVEELALELNFPVLINDKTILLTGLVANKTQVKLDADMPRSSLDVLGFNFGVNRTFDDKWSATFMAFSKIASDKIKLSNENFQLGLLSLFTNKKSADLKYRYGVYANTEKYGLIVVPILGLYYMSDNKKFVANLNLPIIGDINYQPEFDVRF